MPFLFRVHTATKEDIPTIVNITKEYPALLLQYLAKSKIVKQFLPRILIHEGGGYIHYGCGNKNRNVHICQIAVKNQRKGIGIELIQFLQCWRDRVTVDCSIRNKKASAFYKKAGFREVGRRTFFNKAVNRNSTFVRFEWTQ